jgi:hypothetical protein
VVRLNPNPDSVPIGAVLVFFWGPAPRPPWFRFAKFILEKRTPMLYVYIVQLRCSSPLLFHLQSRRLNPNPFTTPRPISICGFGIFLGASPQTPVVPLRGIPTRSVIACLNRFKLYLCAAIPLLYMPSVECGPTLTFPLPPDPSQFCGFGIFLGAGTVVPLRGISSRNTRSVITCLNKFKLYLSTVFPVYYVTFSRVRLNPNLFTTPGPI